MKICVDVLVRNDLSAAGGVSSEVWNRVSIIAPVKKLGRARLSTGLWKQTMVNFREQDAFVKFCKRRVYFTFNLLRKSSSFPTSKSRTFWGIRDKCFDVNLLAGTPQYEPDCRHEYFIRAIFVAVSYQWVKLRYFLFPDSLMVRVVIFE